MGIAFALGALVCWGLGDFFIQKTSRKIGVVPSLFFICTIGAIVLLPFVYSDITPILGDQRVFWLLFVSGVVMFFGSLFNFEGLKEGKISVVEPISSFELPITVLLAIAIVGEMPTSLYVILICLTFIGIILVSTSHKLQLHYHKRLLEKGVIMAGVGAVGMALSNFLVGYASKEISAITVVWFVHAYIAILCFVYLTVTLQLKDIPKLYRKHTGIIYAQSLFDNAAWILYGLAAAFIPLSIAITISEGYIAFASVLGVMVNKEKLKRHQYVGIIIVITGVTALSYAYGK